MKYFCDVQDSEISDLKIWIIPLKKDRGHKEVAMPLLQISMEKIYIFLNEKFGR